MLNNVTNYDVTVGRAVGQHEVFEAQFQSTEILTGNTLNVDLGLFLQNQIDTSSGAPWTTTYPSSPGLYDMVFQGIQTSQNYRVELQVIDGLSFIIRAHFIMRADTGKFVSEGGANNAGSFTEFSFNGQESIYESPKWFAIRCEHQNDVGIHYRPIAANWYEDGQYNPLTYTLKINGAETSGFVIGQDLTVEFELEGSSIASDYDLAVIRVDNISGGGDFVTAHDLNYGRVTDNVSQVENVPHEALKDGTPISYTVPGFGNGTFVIDGNHFVAGATYRFYIIFRNIGLSLPALSNDIESSNLDADYPVTVGDITCTVGEQDCYTLHWTTGVAPYYNGSGNGSTWTAQIVTAEMNTAIDTVTAISSNGQGAILYSGSSFAIWQYQQPFGSAAAGSSVTFSLTMVDGSTFTMVVPLSGQLADSGEIETCDETTLFETCCVRRFLSWK